MTVLGHDVVDIAINWFPMLLLIGVWVFFLRQMRGGGGRFGQYQKDFQENARRQNELLERIAVALEKKN
jgi:ATP-dependent Zn protease